jgi:hypothetical protein
MLAEPHFSLLDFGRLGYAITRRKNMAVHLSAEKQADYSDYLKRFQEDPHSISTEEAAQRYQELVRHAPPELAAEANQQIMGLLPQNERDVLATNIQGGSQTPQTLGLLDHILGKDSVLNTPLGKMILSAAVAYLANRMLNQQQGQAGTRAPSGGLGDLISTILSGAAATQTQGGNQQSPAGGLGDILGAILGGQAQGGQQMPAGQVPTGGLGDILGALMGGQVQQAGSGQAPAGGLGDILGALMGGAPDAPAADPEPEQPPIRTHRKQ